MFTVRPAVPSDVPELLGLYRQLDEVHARAEPALIPTPDELPRRVSDIEETVRDVMAPMFVAVHYPDDGEGPGQIVGFCKVRVRKLGRYWKVETMPEVDELSVTEAVRGMGVGRMLMSAAEEWARGAGYPEIWVAAWAFNTPASSLYVRQGFEPLNTRYRKKLGE